MIMTKQEKFDVAVAAFEALLKTDKLWREYFTNITTSKPNVITNEVYTSWKDWALNTPTYQWCSGAFIWDKTQQGHSIWRDFDYAWLKWICRNLNN